MPRLSDSMEEGTIIRWLVEDGAQVARGQEIVEIETDKATMTYEADDAGTLHLVAGEGDTLPIGAVIATVGDAPAPAGGGNGSGDGLASAPAPAAAPAPAEAPAEAAPAPPADATPPATPAAPAEAVPAGPADAADDDGDPSTSPAGAIAGRTKASPVARRLAREHGIGLDKLTGTGPSGRIVKADVLAAAEQAPAIMAEVRPETSTGPAAAPTPPPPRTPPPVPVGAPAEPVSGKGEVRVVELSRLQQVIARRMAEAKATIPEFTLSTDVDMHDAVALRDQLKTLAGPDQVVPSYNDMIVKATALALREHPRANASYKDARFELYSRINIGVAVAATDALVVPTIFDADHKTLTDIATTTRTLAARVRDNTITPPELSGATFTISNLGMYGITHFTAVINPPQAGILAVGALEPRPVSRDGDIVSRPTLTLTLTSDHRILYGADAAVFLGAIKRNLEHPLTLAL
jgi:pyruvate dehydrogenase E2 component (dihydrolipoamide acetyltransferase)